MASRGSLSQRAAPAAAPAAATDLVDLAWAQPVSAKDQPSGYAGLDSAGRLPMVDVPAVLCQARGPQPTSGTVAQTCSAQSTWYPVLLPFEDFDDDNMHSTVSNTGRFTAARAAIYRFSAQVLWSNGQSTSSPIRQMRFAKNGSVVTNSLANIVYTATTLVPHSVGPLFIALGVGDYVEAQVASQLAGATLFGNADTGSMMSAELLRTL